MDLETVNRLINHYNITYSRDASPIWKGLLSLFPPCLIDLLAAQKYQQAIEGRFYCLRYGQYGYPKDPAAARKLNDERVDAGDQQAILTKCRGLVYGRYDYLKDSAAARKLNDELVAAGNEKAILRKCEGLAKGLDGYLMNLPQLRLLRSLFSTSILSHSSLKPLV
jgi:hypothetical protein